MAVTYGFYNSLNGDRTYNAEQMSSIFDGIITDGVFSAIGDGLMTVSGTGMQVIVKTGKCWFNSTWTLNDAAMTLPIDTADVSLTRIDAVIVEINSAISTRANSIKILKGTPSANPTKPTLAADEDLHQYALAYVTVPAGATAVTASNIEVNVGKTGCPFITSVLQQTDITDLFNQWDADFNAWFDDIQSQLEGDVATNLQNQINQLKENTTIGSDTKARFARSDNNVDPYLNDLGLYKMHHWKQIDGGDYSDMVYSSQATPITSGYVVQHSVAYWSKSITVDKSTGRISLVSPHTMNNISSSTYSEYTYNNFILPLYNNRPCYVALGVASDLTQLYYIPAGATITTSVFSRTNPSFSLFTYRSGSGPWYPAFSNADGITIVQLVTPSSEYSIPSDPTTTDVYSLSRDAYINYGLGADGKTYSYVGAPYEEFTKPNRSYTGGYTGTGSNDISLTLPFVPKLLIIQGREPVDPNFRFGSAVAIIMPTCSKGVVLYLANSYNGAGFTVSLSGTTVSFTLSTDDYRPLNKSGYVYVYTAFE